MTLAPCQPYLFAKEITMADGTIAADELRQYIERVERLSEEKRGLADDIKDVFAEAKAQGFDVAAMRAMVKLRKLEKDVRDERAAMIGTYAEALGLFVDTPLGAFALANAA